MNTPSTPQAKRHIGQILIDQGILTEDQLRIALTEQKRSNQPLGKLLIALGFVTEATMREALSENLNARSADLKSLVVDAVAQGGGLLRGGASLELSVTAELVYLGQQERP